MSEHTHHISAAQRAKLSVAQLAYVASDPRWPEHRAKLAAAQLAKRRALTAAEIEVCVGLRARGASFVEIGDIIGVGRDTLCRELKALGFPMDRVRRQDRTFSRFGAGPLVSSGRRMTLLPEEIAQIKLMRSKGRNWGYISEELCVSSTVLTRELRRLGISTAPVRAEKRAHRTAGFWRSFD